MDRLTGFAIPHERRLPLIRDSDRRDVCCFQPCLRQRLAGGSQLRLPDLIRIVLDPTRLRKDLSKLLLRDRTNRPVVIENDRARTRSALIEGENDGHGWGGGVWGEGGSRFAPSSTELAT